VDEFDGGDHPKLRAVVRWKRIVERSLWVQAIVKGSSESDEFDRSLSVGFAGRSPIAVVSVDHRRS
jgi:hypothetical protein